MSRAVLVDEHPTFAGRIYAIDDAVNRPAPVQPGGVPIVVFVHGDGPARAALLGEAARLADAVAVDGGPDGVRAARDAVESRPGDGHGRAEVLGDWSRARPATTSSTGWRPSGRPAPRDAWWDSPIRGMRRPSGSWPRPGDHAAARTDGAPAAATPRAPDPRPGPSVEAHCYGSPMLIGAHVRAGKGLVPALEHGADIGADAVQIFTQSPRMWKPSQYSDEVLAAYRDAQGAHPSVASTFCHATYLINLASPDPELAAKSRACLTANLATADGMGAEGLVLHIGSHRGSGFDTALPAVAEALVGSLDEVDTDVEGCPILLENAAGAGDTVGRSFEELARVIEAAGDDGRLGVCLDTQHLWASGIPFATVEDADSLVGLIEGTVGMARLRCIHLNDSKVDFGANRDRHENIGDGTIGADGLAALLGHPALQDVPAILEVPGEGDGPRTEDVAAARRVLEAGRALRA